MTIVEFTPAKNIGGAETYLLRLSAFLSERGHRVIVVARDNGALRTPLEALRDSHGIETHFWPFPERKGKRDLRTAWKLARLLRSQRVDVIHTHLAYANYLGGLVGKVVKVPAIAHAHTTSSIHPSPKPYQFSPYVVAVAQEVKRDLMQGGTPEKRIHLVHYGVDTKGLQPASSATRQQTRAAFGLPQDAFVIGVVANLIERKGHRFLFEALDRLQKAGHERVENVHLLLAGDGALRGTLETTARELGWEKRVKFLGFVGEVAPVYAASDLCVLPSLAEGMALCVTEAMACGVPVISSAVSGMPEIVRPGQTGYLCEAGNSEALASVLAQVLDNAAHATQMALNARILMETEFDETLCFGRFEALAQNAAAQWPHVLDAASMQSALATDAPEAA